MAKNAKRIFFLSLIIISGFNIYGFVSTPDVSLLFFFVLYLHAFNAVFKKDNLFSALFLRIFAALIPLVILIQDLYSNYWGKFKKYRFVAYVFLVLILAMRIALVLPLDIKETEFHWEGRKYFEAIKERAGDKKVVFSNSYRRATKYQFYTGGESFTTTYYYYRKSQYDIENYDEIFHNEPVMFIGNIQIRIQYTIIK